MKGVETHSNLRAILCTSGLQQMRDSQIFFIFPILIHSIFKKRKTTGLYLQSKTYNIPVKIIETPQSVVTPAIDKNTEKVGPDEMQPQS